jgi:hypothetical protein
MISPEVKSFDSFVARMGEGKGQILTTAYKTPIDVFYYAISRIVFLEKQST